MRSSLVLIGCLAVFAALSQSRPHTLPKDAETRTLFCSNCLTIVGVINEIVFEDVYRTKQVCDDLCYDLFGHTPSSGIACKQWLDSDLEKIQYKLNNNWSPSAICEDFKLCS